MSTSRILTFSIVGLILLANCSCGVVGPAGAVIAGVAAASGGGGGGGGGGVPVIFPLAVSIGPDTPSGATVAYNASGVLCVQLMLTNNSSTDVDVSSIAIGAIGTLKDDDDFSIVRLYADNDQDGLVGGGDLQVGGNQVFSADNGTATFSFAARTITQGSKDFYLVVVDLAGTADHGENFRIGVTQANDVTAVESGTANPVTVGGPPVYGSTYTIQGVGQLEVSEGIYSPGDGGVPEGSQDVVMLQLRVRAGNAEAITLNSVTFTASAR